MMMNSLKPMTLIAGPCVIEDEGIVMEIATELKRQLSGLPVQLFFKASFDKANRSSIDGFRGPGLTEGLKILEKVKAKLNLPLVTDVHAVDQVEAVASTIDFLQMPAFLCRQTDLVVALAEAALKWNRKLNIKKGQFLAPWDAKNIVEKVRAVEAKHAGNSNFTSKKVDLYLTERGTSFGYNTLVVDMVSFQTMKQFGVPVIYDATHSVQQPGAGPGGKTTGGKREYIETLTRAAFAAGADGLFMECHPRPEQAKSDGPNAFYLEHVGAFVKQILEFRQLAHSTPYLLPETKNFK
jgi:2-dehydro-3-deoxyphosphooctonate aldolase (KDO 8-P synthase)